MIFIFLFILHLLIMKFKNIIFIQRIILINYTYILFSTLIINKEWDNNNLNSYINDCINIENNIKIINE